MRSAPAGSLIIALLLACRSALGQDASALPVAFNPNRPSQDCSPMQQLIDDPRSARLMELLERLRWTEEYNATYASSGGTVLVPTSEAIDAALETVGDGSTWDDVLNMTGVDVWSPILGSYFLTNMSLLPRDVYRPVPLPTWTPYVDPFSMSSVYVLPSDVLPGVFPLFGPTPLLDNATESYWLYVTMIYSAFENGTDVYIPGVTENENQEYRLRAHFTRLLQQGNGLLRHQLYGQSGGVADYSLLCGQLVVYWVEDMLLPVDDLAQLRDWYRDAETGWSSLVDNAAEVHKEAAEGGDRRSSSRGDVSG